MRKIKYLLAVAVMSASLLFGCGSNENSDKDNKKNDKALTTDEFIEKIENNKTEIKSADFEIAGSIDLNVTDESEEEGETAVKGSVKIDGSVDKAGNSKMDISLDAGDMGSTSLEAYYMSEGNDSVVYMQLMDMWYKISMNDISSISGNTSFTTEDTALSSTVDFSDLLSYLSDVKIKAENDTYTLSGALNIKKIYDEIVSTGISEDSSIADYFVLVRSISEDFLDELKINISYSISKEGQFKSFEFSVDKLNYSDDTTKLILNDLKLSLSVDNYNNVSDITISEDAAGATDLASMFGSIIDDDLFEE